VRQVRVSFFALPDSFSAVEKALCPVFKFCAPIIVFGGAEDLGFRLHILRSRTHFRRYRGRRVPSSCFALLDSFSTLMRKSGPVFIFCARGPILGGTEVVRSSFHVSHTRNHFGRYRGAVSHFHVLRSRLHFLRYRGRPVSFFMFCTFRLVFGGTEGIGVPFHVLRSRIRLARYGGRRVPWSCFALPDSFGRYQGCLVPFACFALPNSFSAVRRASCAVFMFCTPGLVFIGTKDHGSRFYVLRTLTHFGRYRGGRVPFHVLRS
jgi:hypothetical protein